MVGGTVDRFRRNMQYGYPLSYSGVFFKKIGSHEDYEIVFNSSDLPSKIEEGKLIIGSNNLELTGPLKVIFENGKFVAKNDQ